MANPSTAAGALAGLLLLSAFAGARAQGWNRSALEVRVLAEINFARMRPQEYGRLLAADADRSPAARDAPAALREALDFLARQRPEAPLGPDAALANAALAHASLQGRTGQIGHGEISGETFGQRLRRYGVAASLMGENIAYGYEDAREQVRQLIVDSGVPDRGHRPNIFNAAYREAGVGCGPHPPYRVMGVIDVTGTLTRR